MVSLTCSGCFPIYQPNQLAHCEFDGCLWCSSTVEDDEIYLRIKTDLENIMNDMNIDKVDLNNTVDNECCICYEVIDKEKNNCVTECGHMFCLKCLVKSMYNDYWTCPYCRSYLVELKPEEKYNFEDDFSSIGTIENNENLDNINNNIINNDVFADNNIQENLNSDNDSEDESNDESEDESEESLEEEPNEYYCTNIEELTQRIEHAGFTTKDLVYMLLERHSDQYTEEQTAEMLDRFDNIIYTVDTEHYESQLFANEDRDIDSIS